jgi:hypothetical protein
LSPSINPSPKPPFCIKYLLPPAWIPSAQDNLAVAQRAAAVLSVSVHNNWTALATTANRTDLARHCRYTDGVLNPTAARPVATLCPYAAACPAGRCRATEVCIPDACGALSGTGTCSATCTPVRAPSFTAPSPAAVHKALQAKADRARALLSRAPCRRAEAVDLLDWNEGAGFIIHCKACPAGQMSDG